MLRTVKRMYGNGELKVVASHSHGIGMAVKVVHIDYDIDDRVFGYVQAGEYKHWFESIIYYEADDTLFECYGDIYNLDEFIRV